MVLNDLNGHKTSRLNRKDLFSKKLIELNISNEDVNFLNWIFKEILKSSSRWGQVKRKHSLMFFYFYLREKNIYFQTFHIFHLDGIITNLFLFNVDFYCYLAFLSLCLKFI